jgi:Ca-activated chloride channel homolog
MSKFASFAFAFWLILSVLGFPQEGHQDHVTPSAETSRPFPIVPSLLSKETAEPGAAPEKEYEEFTISTHVHEVNLILSVTDSKGRFVNDLTGDDIKLRDNNRSPNKWTYFQARTNLPLRVILAIDVSSSIRERLHFEQQAATAFLRRVLRKETDESAIIAFGSTVQVKTVGMTNDLDELDATIHSLQAGGETAMYDAIVASSRILRERPSNGLTRPVIILITDGVDTASKTTLKVAEELMSRSEATIFALDANSIYETDQRGRRVLEKLTHETGGLVLSARENADLKTAFSTIEKTLRSQYALGYPPPDIEANGGFRPIEITSNKRGLLVHARNGYYAPVR